MIVCAITLVKEFLDVNTVPVDYAMEEIHHKLLFAVNQDCFDDWGYGGVKHYGAGNSFLRRWYTPLSDPMGSVKPLHNGELISTDRY